LLCEISLDQVEGHAGLLLSRDTASSRASILANDNAHSYSVQFIQTSSAAIPHKRDRANEETTGIARRLLQKLTSWAGLGRYEVFKSGRRQDWLYGANRAMCVSLERSYSRPKGGLHMGFTADPEGLGMHGETL
jgi:hypothetical protein